MGTQIRQAIASDKAAWNLYVHSHSQATPYHDFSWVESVEEAYGHVNVSLIALNNDKLVGILPIVKMEHPFFGHSLCSLPFCDLGHALADNQEILNALLSQLQHLKESCGAKYIEYRDTARDMYRSTLDITSDENKLEGKKVRMLLSLPETSDQLMSGFKSKLRSQIRKSDKNGLTYQVGNNPELINAFYQVFIHNMRKLGSPVHSKSWYQALRKHYQDDLLVSIIYTQNIPIGAGIVLRNGTKACIPWASTLAEFNHLAPNMLLYWSLLKEVTDSGAKAFDFGRSTYGEGTFNFKQQWGAEPLALNWSRLEQQESPSDEHATPSKLRGMIEYGWSRLPLSMTTMIGPKIRKYISL